MLIIVLAAALTLDAAAIAFFLTHGRHLGNLPLSVAIATAAVLGAGGFVAWISRSTGDAMTAMVAQVNAGFSVLARSTGLEVVAAPGGAGGAAHEFSEARGSFRGARVVVAVQYPQTDELITAIIFPAVPPAAVVAAQARPDLYDKMEAEGQRLTLYLERHRTWTERLRDPLTFDRWPEFDPARLQAAIELVGRTAGASPVTAPVR